MITGQQCYRFNNGAPVFALPHRVQLADGSTRTDSAQWFPLHGAELGWTESTVTVEEAAAYDEEQVSLKRAEKISRLHQWWDNHPGIEVAPGVVLPIQEGGRNTNLNSFNVAFTLNGLGSPTTEIKLVNVRDRTVTIPVETALAAFGVFTAAYDPISQAWDSTMDALESATTIQELEAVVLPQ